MALIKEYFDLTNKYQADYGENTILLMQVGSFFEVYGIHNATTDTMSGSRIADFTRICELNIADKNSYIDKDKVIMAGFKDIMIEKYMRKIQDAGFTVVVYTQDESAKNTSRSLQGIYSPGTYFAEETTNLTNNLTCIWIELVTNKMIMKGKFVVVGISNIDIYTGKTSIFQFKEKYTKNPTNFDELERFISIYNPSEVIIISNLPNPEIDDVINYTNIKCNSIFRINTEDDKTGFAIRVKNCEKQSYQMEIINKFYQDQQSTIFNHNFYEHDIATRSFCFLLDFVFQHNPHLVRKISEPVFENCTERLILANHSLKQLNIIDDYSYTGKYSSVLKMLNGCITPMGKRKFTYMFLNPTTNTNYLQGEYDITEHILSKYDEYDTIFRSKLSSIKDISKWTRQIVLRKISPVSFYNLYKNLDGIRFMYEEVIKDEILKTYLKSNEKNILEIGTYCENIMKFIADNMVMEELSNIGQTHGFDINFIKTGVDSELDIQTKSLNDSLVKLESIRCFLNGLIEQNEKKSGKSTEYVKVHETEKNNYSLLTTHRRATSLFNASQGDSAVRKLKANEIEFDFEFGRKDIKHHKQSATNTSIESEQINDLCKNITVIKVNMKDTITSVYNKLVEKFEEFQENMECIVNFVTTIDLVFARATIAKKYNYCKPIIADANKSFIDVKNLRHCLIEQLQTSELYVTNDITIGNGVVDGMLLYGTNAVGKTSFIRALGISLIMAQSGLYVPSSSFRFKPYKYLFTRIIGNDNIFKGLSTFAVEMSELRTILNLADKDSLILGDELCSGTENTSAVSIFVAGIQKLQQLNSSFIFATHLHEIVEYEEIVNLPAVVLKHMTVIYDKERDLLIYDRKLKDGPGNSMYGLEVCKSLNLPDDFLSAAYAIRAKYHPESGSILSLKTSHFNAKKLRGLCEMCKKNLGTEVHHLQHQRDADSSGIIANEDGSFHKNKVANLMTLCENCHNNMHKTDGQHKWVKTTKGYELRPV